MGRIYEFRKVKLKMLNILDVAKYFLSLVDEEGGSVITHLKLQKLCYYAQAWFLAFEGRPMFSQDFQAWAHGPVCPQLWRAYKGRGYAPINRPEVFDISIFPPQEKHLLDEIWKVYGDYDAKYLERLTHQELPWIEARNGCQPDERCDNVINNTTITQYYRSLLEEKQ